MCPHNKTRRIHVSIPMSLVLVETRSVEIRHMSHNMTKGIHVTIPTDPVSVETRFVKIVIYIS
jgi:hypothetical protein